MTHIRLLMLEDSPFDAELIERTLRRAQLDFSVTVVDDERSFRSMLENSDPDVILSDYHLPTFDGVTALRIARVMAPSTPFIFVSGSIGEERAVEVLREGATDYVLKDRLSRLASAIVRALAERRERLLRQNVENALRASEQRFQYAAAATREVIWDWNLATSRIWFSDALRDHWGYDFSHREADSTWLDQRIHPDDRAAMTECVREALRTRDRFTVEFRLARADDSYSNVLLRGLVVCGPSGEPVRLIGAILDITERLLLESQLEQVRRIESLGRVAATVAHEFNNVLMGILPLAQKLQRSETDPTVARMASVIADSISRGRRLTEQILRYSKPADPTSSVVVVGEWLDRLLPELRALAGNRVAVNAGITEPSLAVNIDAPQMQQVLSNLIMNAREAMPEGGAIAISAEIDGEIASLIVSDEGVGMAPEVSERMFEPLFTTKRNGTGLGLAVAQQIVARHRGSIQVTSKVGQGTTVRIRLPLIRMNAMPMASGGN